MKILSQKIVIFSLIPALVSIVTGCASVPNTTQSNEHTSQIIAQAKNLSSVVQPTKYLLGDKPISMEFSETTNFSEILKILTLDTPIKFVLDNALDIDPIGLYQNDIATNILFNRVLEANCLSYRKIDANTFLIYKPENKKCQFTPLQEAELANLPELQKTVTSDGENPVNFLGVPLNFGYYLSQIRHATQLDMLAKDILHDNSENYGRIQLKANNQPAYKVLQALSTANCFDIAQLSDKSLFLFPKPTSAKCEPVKNGTTITVE